jgi:hypothetical protein
MAKNKHGAVQAATAVAATMTPVSGKRATPEAKARVAARRAAAEAAASGMGGGAAPAAAAAASVTIPKISSLPTPFLRKELMRQLEGMDETHTYNAGQGHPINYILKKIDSYGRQWENYRSNGWLIAMEFLDAVRKYINAKAIDATWDGNPQKMILLSDWGRVFG